MCAHCYKAAAEASRYRLLAILKAEKEGLNVSSLARRLKLRQPTVTHHLKTLEGAGLVVGERHGREKRFRLNRKSECYDECGLLRGL